MLKRKVLNTVLNAPVVICDNLVGVRHTKKHRAIAGFCICIFGVGVVKCFYFFPFEIFHFTGDVVGYLIHGIGGTPIVEAFFEYLKELNKDVHECPVKVIEEKENEMEEI